MDAIKNTLAAMKIFETRVIAGITVTLDDFDAFTLSCVPKVAMSLTACAAVLADQSGRFEFVVYQY